MAFNQDDREAITSIAGALRDLSLGTPHAHEFLAEAAKVNELRGIASTLERIAVALETVADVLSNRDLSR